MIRSLCVAAALALALAPASAAFARTKHHGHAKHGQMKHSRTAMNHADGSLIDRCDAMHYSEKVSCLTRSRGGPSAAYSDATAMINTSGTR